MSTSTLTLIVPNLVNPTDVLSVDADVIPIQIQTDSSVSAITVNGVQATDPTSFYDVNGIRIFSFFISNLIVSNAPTKVNFVGINQSGLPPTPTLSLSYLLAQSTNLPAIDPPSGVIVSRGQTQCKVEWVIPTYLQNSNTNFLGVRVLYSTDPTGVTVPYTPYGSSLITSVSRISTAVISSSNSAPTTVSNKVALVTGNLTITTVNNSSSITRYSGNWILDGVTSGSTIEIVTGTTSTTLTVAGVTPYLLTTVQTPGITGTITPNNVYFYDSTSVVTSSTVSNTYPVSYSNAIFSINPTLSPDSLFYVLLSSVVQDTSDGHIYESNFNGPFTCGFVDLTKVSPTDFPYVQQKESIAGRLIQSMTMDYPDLDLTPRSELRDILIDPVAIELANQSIREWFARVSRSISALSQFDDYNGDGFSDSITESPWKSMVASSWSMNAVDFQTFVDKQFDILGDQVGLSRGGVQFAVAPVTFYTYIKPTSSVTIDTTAIVGSLGDSENPPINFYCQGVQVIDPSSLDKIYNQQEGYWAITLPCQAEMGGSAGNVGAGAITSAVSGVPAGWLVNNFSPASYGSDGEINSSFAARIKNKQVVGVDTGRRLGYQNTALATPGVVGVNVVASGDLEMLRDWYPQGNRHLFGTVDVYVRGGQYSVQSQSIPYSYTATQGVQVNFVSLNYNIITFSIQSALPLISITNLTATNNTTYNSSELGTVGVQFLSFSNGLCTFTIDGSENSSLTTAGNPISNQSVVSSLLTSNGTVQKNISFSANIRPISPLSIAPPQQPISEVYSVVGDSYGLVDPSLYRLIRQDDPFLLGFSSRSSDTVQVDGTTLVTPPIQKSINTTSALTPIDSLMAPTVNSSKVLDVLSVLSSDGTIRYIAGTDYTIVPSPPIPGQSRQYGSYSLNLLNTQLLNQLSQQPPANITLLVSYNKYLIGESCTQRVETLTLSSNSPVPLSHAGIIQESWVINTYGYNIVDPNDWITLTFVTQQGVEEGAVNGQDYIVTIDPSTQIASITIHSTSTLLTNNLQVTLTYYTNEMFNISTGYPSYVESVATSLATTQNAGADVVVKEMMNNNVDVHLVVELSPSTSPQTIDSSIRTTIGVTLSNASSKLSQSEMIRRVQSIPGVSNVQVPLTKFVKSDGSYNIGTLLPVGTSWVQYRNYSSIFLTALPVLTDATIPGGGETDAYVGFLYEGDPFTRCSSQADLLSRSGTLHSQSSIATSGNFYIVGASDPSGLTPGTILVDFSDFFKSTISKSYLNFTPSNFPFRATYQIWNESGAHDIVMSSTEYLSPGDIVIDYIIPKS